MSEKKRELNYLAVSYDTKSKPKTAYSDQLMQYVTELLGLKGDSADSYVEFTHVTPFTERSLEQSMRMYGLVDVSVQSFIQLPPVWRYPVLKPLCDVINLLPVPKSAGKRARWSKERVLLGIGRKAGLG